jgi:hypothetical protein
MLTVQQELSLKLKQEHSKLVPPYIALDFDQHAISQDRITGGIHVADFETMKHLVKYGRPLYVFLPCFSCARIHFHTDGM